MKSRMTVQKYEGSKADRKNDRKEAKRHHESVKRWERATDDSRMDRAAVRKINKKAKKRK